MITPGRVALLAAPQNQVRYWDGSSWSLKTVFDFNGTIITTVNQVKVWNGSTWLLNKL